jgi:hypothetical protein
MHIDDIDENVDISVVVRRCNCVEREFPNVKSLVGAHGFGKTFLLRKYSNNSP